MTPSSVGYLRPPAISSASLSPEDSVHLSSTPLQRHRRAAFLAADPSPDTPHTLPARIPRARMTPGARNLFLDVNNDFFSPYS